MTVDEASLAEEARAILDSAQAALPGMEAESRVSILGTTVTTDEAFTLGQRVEFRVVGYVASVGDELVDKEGRRHAVKVKTTLITVVDQDGEDDEEEG